MPTELTGMILAGGRSRRFGSDKAQANVGGVTMIAHVYKALAPLCTEVLVSVDRPDRTYPLPGPARFVSDRVPDAGPLAGLDAGLAAAQMPWVLAVACDLPYLTPGVLRTLANAREDGGDAVVGVTPDGRRQPLCACYHRRIQPTIQEQLRSDSFALHALLDRLAVASVALPADALRNVNAPGDLREK